MSDNTLSPVILFVYNRPIHTLKTLEALSQNHLASQTILYIYCDAVKSQHDICENELVMRTQEIVRSKNWCKENYIIYQNSNLGLASSIINGITEVLKTNDSVIVLEDDILTSPYFLTFMNESLNKYRTNLNVTSISGYLYPGLKPNTPFFLSMGESWGWATWKRGWKYFESDGRLLLHKIQKLNLNSKFDFENSYPFSKMLREQILGLNNSWAIRWYASIFLEKKLTFYPNISLVQNIGMDDSGVNCTVSNYYNVTLGATKVELIDIPVEESSDQRKSLAKYFRNEHNISPKNIYYKLRESLKLLMK